MTPLKLLENAIGLIHGQRADDYGNAKENFQRMADLVNPILRNSWGNLTAQDMALVMIQVKVARLVESPDHEDSWTDIAGYAALGGSLSPAPPDRTAAEAQVDAGLSGYAPPLCNPGFVYKFKDENG